MLERIVQAHQRRQAVVSEMVMTPKVNATLEHMRQVATSLIVLHPTLGREHQQKIDRVASSFEGVLKDTNMKLGKLQAELKTLWSTLDPSRQRALEQTRKNLQRAFK